MKFIALGSVLKEKIQSNSISSLKILIIFSHFQIEGSEWSSFLEFPVLLENINGTLRIVCIQLDEAPCYYERSVQKNLAQFFRNKLIKISCLVNWHSSSPELIFMNFYFWRMIKDLV